MARNGSAGISPIGSLPDDEDIANSDEIKRSPTAKGCKSVRRTGFESPMPGYSVESAALRAMNVSGVPSRGSTKMMSVGSRLGVSTDRNTTGCSKSSGMA
jgi:hypothetical protein